MAQRKASIWLAGSRVPPGSGALQPHMTNTLVGRLNAPTPNGIAALAGSAVVQPLGMVPQEADQLSDLLGGVVIEGLQGLQPLDRPVHIAPEQPGQDGFDPFVRLRRIPAELQAAHFGHVLTAVVVVQDLHQIDALQTLVGDHARDYGRVYGLCHCAGIVETRPLTAFQAASFREMVDVNVIAALELARRHYREALCAGPALNAPAATRQFLTAQLRDRPYEVFCCLHLDNRHRLIHFEEVFRGTIDGASVHPREVVRQALRYNAAALIFAHNHPSGVAEASQADELITRRLRDALALVDIRVLDHLIVGDNNCLSFAERGLL